MEVEVAHLVFTVGEGFFDTSGETHGADDPRFVGALPQSFANITGVGVADGGPDLDVGVFV